MPNLPFIKFKKTYRIIGVSLKCLLCVILLSLSLSGKVSAQTTAKGLGVKAGYQLSNVTHRSFFNRNQSGLYAGVFLQKSGWKNLEFQHELLYSQEGHDFTADFQGYGLTNLAIKLHYLEGNSSIKFRLFNNFFLYPGLQFSVLLSHQTETTNDKIDYLKYEDPNSLELSLMGGAVYEFNEDISVNLRYTRGIMQSPRNAPDNVVFSFGVDLLLL
jgi:hypothetical protein